MLICRDNFRLLYIKQKCTKILPLQKFFDEILDIVIMAKHKNDTSCSLYILDLVYSYHHGAVMVVIVC